MLIHKSVDHDVTGMIGVVQKEKLIEPCGQEELRWVHDKIQEAALSLSKMVTSTF